jgi:hypothetical protein
MQVEGNRVVRADEDYNTLNRGEFLDRTNSEVLL